MVVTTDSIHYYQGNRTNVGGIRETDDISSSLREGSPQTSSSSTSHYKAPSGSTDYTSPSSCLTSLCEDADSGTFTFNFAVSANILEMIIITIIIIVIMMMMMITIVVTTSNTTYYELAALHNLHKVNYRGYSPRKFQIALISRVTRITNQEWTTDEYTG